MATHMRSLSDCKTWTVRLLAPECVLRRVMARRHSTRAALVRRCLAKAGEDAESTALVKILKLPFTTPTSYRQETSALACFDRSSTSTLSSACFSLRSDRHGLWSAHVFGFPLLSWTFFCWGACKPYLFVFFAFASTRSRGSEPVPLCR